MEQIFIKNSTAVCGTGGWRFFEEFYTKKAKSANARIVNMQLRYWIEAVEKFHNLPEREHQAETIEEAILIINLLGNSLLVLGGANWRGNGYIPSLLELYGGNPFDLRCKQPELYQLLKELSDLYNKLSKHFSLEREDLFQELTYAQLSKFYHATADIWLFVCDEYHDTHEFDVLFTNPRTIIKRGYFPEMPNSVKAIDARVNSDQPD